MARVAYAELLVLAVAAAGAPMARAHERSISYSTWELRGGAARVVLRMSALDVSRLPWASAADSLEARLGDYVVGRLRLGAADAPCTVAGEPRRLGGEAERMIFEWRLACPEGGALRLTSDLFRDVTNAHLHFIRVVRDGAPPVERVLSDAEPAWVLDEAPAAAGGTGGTSLAGYIGLGIEHILTGYDHLVFLGALLLIEVAFLEVAKVVTGFTVAHSITLGLASLGYVRPPAGAIEALIGLSIVMVALENVWLCGKACGTGAISRDLRRADSENVQGRTANLFQRAVRGRAGGLPRLLAVLLLLMTLGAAAGYGRVPPLALAGLALFAACYFGLLARSANPARLRWAIAFLFGLVHGFGFASVLLEAELPAARLVHALFGFNAGVEIGQLAAVALAWPLLRWLVRPQRTGARQWVIECGSAAALAVGVFWFVTRAYG